MTHLEMRMQASLLQSNWQDDDEGKLQDVNSLPTIKVKNLQQAFNGDYESSFVQTTKVKVKKSTKSFVKDKKLSKPE